MRFKSIGQLTESEYGNMRCVEFAGGIIEPDYNNVDPANAPTQADIDAAERMMEVAVGQWHDGECCGHHHCVDDNQGWCHMSIGHCYKHVRGVVRAREEWERIEASGNPTMSPWRRAAELERLLKQMEGTTNDGTEHDGDGFKATGDRDIQQEP